jgi:hypothetical protein
MKLFFLKKEPKTVALRGLRTHRTYVLVGEGFKDREIQKDVTIVIADKSKL